MRTTKFRGLSKETNEWVYGYYCQARNKHCIIIEEAYLFYADDKADAILCGIVEVISETAGQFTGLLDKNGKEICEGDKIQGDNWQFEVIWQKVGFGLKGLKHGWWRQFDEFEEIEVIGNIHEHKHLLD